MIRMRQITHQFSTSDGDPSRPPLAAVMLFTLASPIITPAETVAPHSVAVALVNGALSVTLPCDDDSLLPTRWLLRYDTALGRPWVKAFDLAYGDGSPVDLASLLVAGTTPIPTTTAQSLYDALDVRIDALEAGGGSGGASYTHIQSSAASTWTVNHNLGVYPIVAVLSSGGANVSAGITHTSLNQILVSVAPATTGRVICKG